MVVKEKFKKNALSREVNGTSMSHGMPNPAPQKSNVHEMHLLHSPITSDGSGLAFLGWLKGDVIGLLLYAIIMCPYGTPVSKTMPLGESAPSLMLINQNIIRI